MARNFSERYGRFVIEASSVNEEIICIKLM